MVPTCKPSSRHLGTCGIQYAVGLGLVAVGQLTSHEWLFYTYYGVGIVVVPGVVRIVSGRMLAPLQRLYVSLGLALHPVSMYFLIYPKVWWWDILTHFVSGTLLAGGLYVALRGLRGAVGSRPTAAIWVHLVVLLGVLWGGITWEIYEIYAPWLTVYGPVDTAKDLVVAVIGWLTVAVEQPRILGAIPHALATRLGGPTRSWSTPDSPGVEPTEPRMQDVSSLRE